MVYYRSHADLRAGEVFDSVGACRHKPSLGLGSRMTNGGSHANAKTTVVT